MPLMWKQGGDNPTTSAPGMHFLTEDPRAGHNVMYFGQGKNAYDSVSLKPLWGLAGTFKISSTGSYYGGAPQLLTTNAQHYHQTKTYMMLAGAQPMGYGKNQYSTTVNNGTTYQNVHAGAFMNMDNEQRTTQHFVKDNGDGTHTLYINSMEHGNMGDQYYAEGYYYHNIPDDLELYEVAPDYRYSTSSTAAYRGVPTSYTALDGTNSGFMVLSNNMGSYPQYANITMHRINTSTTIEKSGLSTSTNAGYYAQFAGMSRADGMPIFFEYRHSLYTPFFRVTKYNGSSFTTLFSNYNTTNGWQRHRYYTTSTSYAQALSATSYDHNTGTTDSFMTLASSWFRGAGHTANYYFTIVPTTYAGTPYADVIRWDRSTDTFIGAGVVGASTDYATAYHFDNGYNGWRSGNWPSNLSNYVENPLRAASVAGSNRATSSGHSGTHQALAYALACDAHGFANADGSVESPFQTEDYPGGGNVQPITFMNMTGIDGAFDARKQGRVLFLTTQNVDNAAYLNGAMQARAITQIPETPIDYVWCDSGKTTLGVICKNATYIYQCRKGASLTNGATNGNPMSYAKTGDLNTATFNLTVNASAIGWIHTATIPYQVMQMGIDKHDRLWYVTYNAAGPYYQSSSTNDSYYHKQMWMLTTATPHKVNLTGNATTDTISYSGSNIDKTLTIEALNFKGQRLAKTITLNITSTSAQFDNGSQTKDVTTSASATVNETITVTGAGSFNITAAYGA